LKPPRNEKTQQPQKGPRHTNVAIEDVYQLFAGCPFLKTSTLGPTGGVWKNFGIKQKSRGNDMKYHYPSMPSTIPRIPRTSSALDFDPRSMMEIEKHGPATFPTIH
jgi:hypothetical protein